MGKNTKKPPVNIIEIGKLRVVTETSKLPELVQVADKFIKKHKDLIKKEDQDIPMEMYG